MPRAAFVRRAARQGLALDPKSRMAFSGTMFFMNGETVALPALARPWARRLADARRLPGPIEAPAAFWDAAHEWYRQGFVTLEEPT